MPDGLTMLVEYKLFEPAFYSMDVPDWGTSLLHCQRLGPKAQVLVDTGHHAPSTNIEMIVALLLREGRLGGFHFNSRYYADDDLMVGAADPFQLFRIMCEIVQADALDSGVAFMLDQCHNIEPKVAGQIRSVMNVQEATAKALLVDRDQLADAQARGDILGAHGALMDAFATDVRPLLVRAARGAGPRTRSDEGLPGLRLLRVDRRRAWQRRPVGLGQLRWPTSATRTVRSPTCWRGATDSAVIRATRNYAGGNASAKAEALDPATGQQVRCPVRQGVRG